jgi:phenylacetic acid degradation operon negative regulatory protein
MKPRSLLFTLYGDYIRNYGGEIWIGSLIRMMSHFGVSESSLRGAVLRMVQQELLKVRKIGNRSYYSLTKKGARRVEDGITRVYSIRNTNWDGSWRILIYTIPEEKRELRNQIRKELSWTGFGMIAHSTWASPNPLEKQVMEIVKNYELENYTLFFKTQGLLSHSDHELVNKGWDLKEIAAKYDLFIQQYQTVFEKLKERAWNNTLSEEESFVERTKLVHEYRKFLFLDPGLPVELLPENWNGFKAKELFFNLHQLLSVPAIKYFEALFEPAPDGEYVVNRDRAINPFIV